MNWPTDFETIIIKEGKITMSCETDMATYGRLKGLSFTFECHAKHEAFSNLITCLYYLSEQIHLNHDKIREMYEIVPIGICQNDLTRYECRPKYLSELKPCYYCGLTGSHAPACLEMKR